mmetsp:Transcript_10168/g.33963  ORF Transcript_10168/g.33963 Transcript_10168/m.33963 type:complete len:280 (+) Transcript_10168:1024-1863(+)
MLSTPASSRRASSPWPPRCTAASRGWRCRATFTRRTPLAWRAAWRRPSCPPPPAARLPWATRAAAATASSSRCRWGWWTAARTSRGCRSTRMRRRSSSRRCRASRCSRRAWMAPCWCSRCDSASTSRRSPSSKSSRSGARWCRTCASSSSSGGTAKSKRTRRGRRCAPRRGRAPTTSPPICVRCSSRSPATTPTTTTRTPSSAGPSTTRSPWRGASHHGQRCCRRSRKSSTSTCRGYSPPAWSSCSPRWPTRSRWARSPSSRRTSPSLASTTPPSARPG